MQPLGPSPTAGVDDESVDGANASKFQPSEENASKMSSKVVPRKNSIEQSEFTQAETVHFAKDELVWAKMRFFSAWPARVSIDSFDQNRFRKTSR